MDMSEGMLKPGPLAIDAGAVAARPGRAAALRRRGAGRGRDDLGVSLLRPARGAARIPSRAGARRTGGGVDAQCTPTAAAGAAASRWKPAHNPSPAEMRRLFEGAGFTVSDQHRVRRPVWTWAISDLITVGIKS